MQIRFFFLSFRCIIFLGKRTVPYESLYIISVALDEYTKHDDRDLKDDNDNRCKSH